MPSSPGVVPPASSRPLSEGERWYVVYTLPHGETTAQFHLRNQGFHTFLPQYAKTIRHARSLKRVTAPLFSRYLFVVLNLNRDRWRSVNGSCGVATLIMRQEDPVPVVKGVVETLLEVKHQRG